MRTELTSDPHMRSNQQRRSDRLSLESDRRPKTSQGMEFARLVRVKKLHPNGDRAGSEKQFRRDRRPRPRSGIGLLAVFSLLSITLGVAASASADPSPRLELEGMTFVASRENNDAVILRAERARFDTEAKKAYLRVVDAAIPARSGQRGFQLRCDTGVVDLVSNDFEATGNVIGEADSGEHFETEWVRYDHEKGVFYTDVPVLITHRGTTLRGGGFNYDIAKRRFKLLGGARIVQDVKEGIGQ